MEVAEVAGIQDNGDQREEGGKITNTRWSPQNGTGQSYGPSFMMAIESGTRTGPFVVPLVETWASHDGEPANEFLHALEDTFFHEEIGPQAYSHL